MKDTTDRTFSNFYDIAPKEFKSYLDRASKTPQTKIWHPEKDVLAHTKIVFNRAKRTRDINFMLAALFHDLGKVDVTKKHPTIPNKWIAYGHEFVSARLVEKYKDWIESLGGDFSIIYYIVRYHMRAKQLDQMKPAKQQAFKSHSYYEYVHQFSDFDDMLKDFSNDLE